MTALSMGEDEEDEVIVFKGRDELSQDIPFNLNLDDFDDPMPFNNTPRKQAESGVEGSFSLASLNQPWSSIWDEAPSNQKSSEFSKTFNSSSLFAFNSADHRSNYASQQLPVDSAVATGKIVGGHADYEEPHSGYNPPLSAENVFLASRSLLQAPLPRTSARAADPLPFPAWDRPSSQAHIKHDWEAFPRQASEHSPIKTPLSSTPLMPPPGMNMGLFHSILIDITIGFAQIRRPVNASEHNKWLG
jgi:hypothetical protein